MQSAPLRGDEDAALAALNRLDVLDSAAEAEFDALVLAASTLCGAPISLLSLVDEHRQWFKANVGLAGVTETSRELAFCAHAVLHDDLFEVSDATTDVRFADNPLVLGDPSIRFYAGAPLSLANGERVGTLCVIDRQPRRLDATQREVLRCLAIAASRALEGRRALRELARAAGELARAKLVEQHSADAIIGFTAEGGVSRWNPAAERLFGYTATEVKLVSPNAAVHRLRDNEASRVLEKVSGGQACTYEGVWHDRQGNAVHVSVTAVPELDEAGNLTGMTEFVRDISDRVRMAEALGANETRMRRMYEATPAMLHSVDRQGHLLAVSDLWLSKLGYERQDVIGKFAADLLAPESRERSITRGLPTLFTTGRLDAVEYQIRTRDGRLKDVLLSAVVDWDPGDGLARSLTVMEDITERRLAERSLREERERLADIVEGTQAGTWEYQLSGASGGGNGIVNEVYSSMLGLSASNGQALSERQFAGLVHMEDRERVFRAWNEHLRGDSPRFEAEFRIRHGSGRWIWVLSRGKAVARDADGRALKVAGIQLDISGRVAEREALAAARHDLQSILDAVPSMIGYWDSELCNRVANRAYERFFGVEPATLMHRSMQSLLGDRLFELNRPHVEAALRGEAQVFERSIPKPGGTGSLHTLAHYLPDVVDGKVRGFYVLVHDISEIVETRQQLAQAQRETQGLLRTLQEQFIVSVADPAGNIVEVNDSFCRISGYSRDELLGQNHRMINSGHHVPEFWRNFWHEIADGRAWRGDVCNRAKDGSIYWVNSVVAPFFGTDGSIEKYISIRSDITAVKLAEQRLRSSEAFLERAGQIAGVGGWELDLQNSSLQWTNQTYRLHEVPAGYVPTLDAALNFYAPEARPLIERAVAEGIETGNSWDLELPLVTAAGRTIWVRAVGTAEFESGRAVRLVGAFQDISERRQAEAALTYERQLMSSLLETLPDQIYFKDRESRFLRINPALARRFGLTDASSAIGKSDADFFAAEHAARTMAAEALLMVSGEPLLNLEEQELWLDRSPTWNLTTKMPLRDAEGRVIGTFGISRDITARRRMEEELHLTNQRFSLAAESVGLGVWERDVIAGDLVWDERMYRLFGRTRQDGIPPHEIWGECLHAGDRARIVGELQDAINGVCPYDTTFRIVRPDGSIRHLRGAAHVVRDADGRALRMIGVNFDVSERVRAEDELRETMSLLNAVLDSATQVSIIAVKPDGIVSVFNSGAEAMLGYAKNEVVDHEKSLIFHDAEEMRQRAHQLSEQWGRKVHTGMVLVEPDVLGKPQDWTYVRKDGSAVPVSLAVTAMRSDLGELFGYLGVAHDVSRQKEQERSLREAMHKANQANRAKSQFLANMSHEIRTPMNAVIGLTYLLERTTLDGEQADFIGKIKIASKSLLASINDVLDLSKIEAAEMRIEHIPFSLRQLLSELGEMTTLQAQAKNVTFDLDVGAELPAALEGDATRVRQVLGNLLTNAVKFTEHGGVRLTVHQVDATTDPLRLRFTVSDSGIGIEGEALDSIFTPFVQADVSTTRRFGGTGLGLSIVKRLVALMGGEIGVSSTPKLGSEFWVELAFPVGDASAIETDTSTIASGQGAPSLRGVSVLVADDSAINREVAKRILELEGASVWLAEDGQQAVEHLLAAPGAVDIVLMDVHMPVLDGYGATRRIRASLELAGLPVVALTAATLASEHRHVLEAGMNDVLFKPFEAQTLVNCILRFVTRHDRPLEEPELVQRPPVAHDWPRIAGIDGRDVGRRLRGDVDLFRSMLRRLLSDFDDLGREAPSDETALATLAGRMHNLKGSAGTLGAKALERLAYETENACRARQINRAARLTEELVASLGALRRDAASVLQESNEEASTDSVLMAGDLDIGELRELVEQLNNSDLCAVDCFAALSPPLRKRLGPDLFESVRKDVDDLRFSEASEALSVLLRAVA